VELLPGLGDASCVGARFTLAYFELTHVLQRHGCKLDRWLEGAANSTLAVGEPSSTRLIY